MKLMIIQLQLYQFHKELLLMEGKERVEKLKEEQEKIEGNKYIV
jgi:hypothetical protein